MVIFRTQAPAFFNFGFVATKIVGMILATTFGVTPGLAQAPRSSPASGQTATQTSSPNTNQSPQASLQEGWFKIISGGQHTGFMALRIELDKTKKQFISTSYIQTNALGGNLRESLVAVSDSTLLPVSFQYTSQVGTNTKIIDASFSSQTQTTTEKGKKKSVSVQTLTAKIKKGDQTETLQTKLEPKTFLSQFLIYVMLQSSQGLKQGNNFVFNAVLEENGEVRSGKAYVSALEKYRGLDTFKILVTFKDPGTDRSKDQNFINYVTPNGFILMTKAPAMSLSVEMVPTMEEATKGFDVNQKTLSLLFKTMPKSPFSEAPAAPVAASTPAPKSGPETNPSNHSDPSKKSKSDDKGPDSGALPAGVAPPPGKGN